MHIYLKRILTLENTNYKIYLNILLDSGSCPAQ